MKVLEALKKNTYDRFIKSGHARTIQLKKNVLASLIFKGVSVAVNFLLVPLCLDYLDKFQYGIWLIIASFLNWFVLFEIGLGAGLQNKLAEAISLGKIKLGKLYVSTTYVSISTIMLSLSAIFYIVHPFISWYKVFNVPESFEPDLKIMTLIAFSFFFVQFIFRLINFVLYADQKAGISNAIGPISSVLSLIIIFIISKTCKSSLLYLTIAFCSSQLLIVVIANLYFFRTSFRNIRPSIKYFRKSVLSDLMRLGVNFFVIQISAIFMFQATSVIIAQFFSPAEVTQYNVAHRLFSVAYIAFQIITRPLWPAFTEAWTKNDLPWVRNTTNKLVKLWMLVVVGSIFLLIFSKFIYKIWFGDKLEIPLILSFSVALHFILFIYGNIFNVFINGVGKLRVQLVSLSIGAIIYIPIAYFFTHVLSLRSEGIVFAMTIANFYSYIIAPIQYHKIISGKAKGIWNK